MSRFFLLIIAANASAFVPIATAQDAGALADDVRAVEIAFAQTMSDRDAQAFATFVAEDAVFVGNVEALRGRSAVLTGWSRFFEGEQAPFSWAPETVEVLASGDLALTSGPVFGSTGERIGTFNSIWRREDNGAWEVVFDKGCPPCDCDSSE